LALAAGLQLKLNLKPGEIVAVALPTCLEYSITVLALNLCGATSTLINPGQTICIFKTYFIRDEKLSQLIELILFS
jgi:acyl-CoA synthetase (AMP-forming)/AMP-acid ligase II